MKILSNDPVVTAKRVTQLAFTYPVECAQALANQSEAIPMVGNKALTAIGGDLEASAILSDALKADRELQRIAGAFYTAQRNNTRPLPARWCQNYKAIVIGKMLESIFLEMMPA